MKCVKAVFIAIFASVSSLAVAGEVMPNTSNPSANRPALPSAGPVHPAPDSGPAVGGNGGDIDDPSTSDGGDIDDPSYGGGSDIDNPSY